MRPFYRVSQDFLLPAITHQTKVKERHDTLSKFRSGEYPVLVTSKVLNEGVDVPEAKVAVVLSGTGSSREYVQRFGPDFYGEVRANWPCYTKSSPKIRAKKGCRNGDGNGPVRSRRKPRRPLSARCSPRLLQVTRWGSRSFSGASGLKL